MPWKDAPVGSPEVALWNGMQADAEATHPAASRPLQGMGSWSGNPSDLTLPFAAHTAGIVWESGHEGKRQTLSAHHRGSSGR